MQQVTQSGLFLTQINSLSLYFIFYELDWSLTIDILYFIKQH